jgi:hypothetical protein
MVIARHRYKVEQAVVLLKGAATSALVEQQVHPLARFAEPGERMPQCWARGEWKVFLGTDTDIERAIRYVEANPEKEGLPKQCWSFVERAPLSSRG